MADYFVQIDNEESNELADVISMTGRVDGVQVAAKVRISLMQKLSEKEQKKFKLAALARAYLERKEKPSMAGAEKVTV